MIGEKMNSYSKLFIAFIILISLAGTACTSKVCEDTICSDYVSEWKAFYPSRAFSLGFHGAIFRFEDFSQENIQAWMSYNREVLDIIEANLPDMGVDQRINARLLRSEILSELDKWDQEATHKNSPGF